MTSNPGVKTVGLVYFEIKYKIVIALQAYISTQKYSYISHAYA